MAIVSSTPPASPAVVDAPLRITAPEYRGVTVDTRYTPKQALLGYVEGSSYTVNYYSQILNIDTGLSGQQVSVSAINQQYRLVKRFELKLTSPLTVSHDTDKNQLVIMGSGNVYSMLKPNPGDMFLGDIGDGQEGIFQVTDSRRMSALKDTIHQIDFQVVDYATPERLADLASKVISTVVFCKNRMDYNASPFLQLEEYDVINRLTGYSLEITEMYFQSFFSNEYKTLIVPDQEYIVYDAFLTEAVLSLFDTYDAPELRQIRKLNCDGNPVMKVTTIWNALMKRSVLVLSRANTRAGMISSKMFNRRGLLEGVYFSGVNYVVYPEDPERSINARDLKHPIPTFGRVTRSDIDAEPAVDQPLIPRVAETDSYVLSDAFYTNAELGQSKLELLVHDYLEDKAIDNAVLLQIAQAYTGWEPIDQFYCGPIVILLIKMSIRGI